MRMRLPGAGTFALVAAALAIGCAGAQAQVVLEDVGRLYPAPVREVVHSREVAELQAAVRRAAAENLKVSIAGKRHSQGGHAYTRDAVVLDMTRFNRILALEKDARILTVQSGATWEDVQNYANAHGLAVKVQQASNIFTVGGSLSVNAHGRDPRFGPVIETVRAFRLLLADGRILRASRDENRELFALAIGGYGLFGVILEVELSLTENDVYEKRTIEMDAADYPAFFKREVLGNPAVGLHYAWPSIAAGGYLKTLLVSTFYRSEQRPEGIFTLTSEGYIPVTRFFLSVSRQSQWGKDLRWALQRQLADRPGSSKLISRNNAMRPGVLFLDYHSATDTDILQEYFVPADRLVAYLDALRAVLRAHDVNLLSATIRYVPGNDEAVLSYAPRDAFSIVLYINQALSAEGRKAAEAWTHELVDVTHRHGGTYYLPYQLYPTREQLLRAYPAFDRFLEAKRRHDPGGLFSSLFYERYRGAP